MEFLERKNIIVMFLVTLTRLNEILAVASKGTQKIDLKGSSPLSCIFLVEKLVMHTYDKQKVCMSQISSEDAS